MPVAKPDDYPDFCTDDLVDGDTGQNNAVKPIASVVQYGFYPKGKKPPRNNLNWLFRYIYKWIRYLEDNIGGGGGSGIPLRVFAASNSLTETKNNADVVCDATDVQDDINTEIAALTAAGATGGILFFAPGTYSFGDTGSSNVNIPANFHVIGSGWNTVFQYGSNTPGSHDSLITLNGTEITVENIWFEGASNTANTHLIYVKNTDCVIKHCRFDNAGGAAVFLKTAHRIEISSCEFTCGTTGASAANYAIAIAKLADTWYSSSLCNIHHNRFYGDSTGVKNTQHAFYGVAPQLKFHHNYIRYLNDGIYCEDSSEILIHHNEFDDPVSDSGTPRAFYFKGCYRPKIHRNNLDGANSVGTRTCHYGIVLEESTTNDSIMAEITFNEIINFKDDGINAGIASLLDGNSDRYSNCVVSYNEVNNNSGCGIVLYTQSGGANYAPVFCDVSFNDVNRNGEHGMNLELAYSDINNNRLYANGTTAGTWAQIRIGYQNSTEKAEHNTIVGNKAHQGASTNKCSYGLWLDSTTKSADDNCVWGNDMRSAATTTTLKNDGTGNQTVSQSGTLSTQNWT